MLTNSQKYIIPLLIMCSNKPLLYSFRRCPYAIRARMALIISKLEIELIEIDLKNKAQTLLIISPKGTVPVLSLPDGKIIEQSLEIVSWAIENSQINAWDLKVLSHSLIIENDNKFKPLLDCYKYHVRYLELSYEEHQNNAARFINLLNENLKQHVFLISDQPSLVDICIFPFIRQFYFVDTKWFDQQDWPHLKNWLEYWLNEALFKQAFEWGR